ncbi:MAG: hypothetical protein ACMG6S_08305 [Byssovorax sp.]
MNGSTQSIYLALGCAAALTASACSRPSQSPSSPSLGQGVGVSSPAEQSPEMTGGSNTQQPGFGSDRESQSTGQPGAMQRGEQGDARANGAAGTGQQGSGAGQQGSGAAQQGTGAGSQMGAHEGHTRSPGAMGGMNDAPSAIDEREACDRLTSEATLRAEPTEGGVVIVARPRRGVDLSTLRSSMQSIHRGIERGAPSSATATCDLFSLARTGVVAIAETPDSIRLLVTTSDAARVPQIRRQANEFIRTSKAGGSTQQNGAPKGGTHKGSTPRGGGTQDRNGGGTPQQGGGTQNQGGGTQNQGGTTPQQGGTTPQGGTP